MGLDERTLSVTAWLGLTVLAGIVVLDGGEGVTASWQYDLSLCNWTPSGPPPALTGQQGTFIGDRYWFSHLSAVDVDTARDVNRFIFVLNNHHTSNYLPAKWERRNGDMRLAFAEIAPNACGATAFSSTLGFKEDSAGRVKYDPLLFSHKEAPLYEPARRRTQAALELHSSIVAVVGQAAEDVRHIDLRFTTIAEEGVFRYRVENQGSHDAVFRIDALSSAWAELEPLASVHTEVGWQMLDDAFLAPAQAGAQEYVVFVSEDIGAREDQVIAAILSPQGDPIGIGAITVHLPVAPEDQ